MHYTQRLKDLREDKDLTQENLAKKLNSAIAIVYLPIQIIS